VALFLPDERVSRVRAARRTLPRFTYYDNRTQRIYLATNIGIRVWKGLYIGGGLTFMSRTKGTVVLEGFLDVAPELDDEDHTDLRADIDVDLKALRYPQFGILWEINKRWAVGVTYRHEFNLELKQHFRIQGDAGLTPQTLLIEDGFYEIISLSTNLYQPMQVVLGVAGRPHDRVLVALDLTYHRWSRFINPGSRLKLDYDMGTYNDQVNLSSQGPPPPPRFNDIVSLRVGVEAEVLTRKQLALALRCGYFFEPSPAPEQTTHLMNLADNDKHGVSFGVGVELRKLTAVLPKPIHLDINVGYIHLPERKHRKWAPHDETGDFVSSGFLISAGAQIRLKF
jgi:long-chain fatty acid transport protein